MRYTRETNRRSRTRQLTIEALESRWIMADLVGLIGNVSPAEPQPGESVSVDWQLANLDVDMIFSAFSVDFWLSRDTVWSIDDRFLSSEVLPPGFPGLFAIPVQTKSLLLPLEDDPFWIGSEYNLLLISDSWNDVFESNEFNNIASVPLNMGEGGGGGVVISDLNELPATGRRSGAVLGAVIRGLQIRLREAAVAQDRMRANLRLTGVFLPNVSDDLRSLASTIGTFGKRLAKLTSGAANQVTLAPGVTFNRSELDLTERYLWYVFSPIASSTTLSQRAASSADSSAGLNSALYDGPASSLSLGAAKLDAAAQFQAAAAGNNFIEEIFPVVKDVREWVENTSQKIKDAKQAVDNAISNPVKFLTGLFGQAGQSQGEAKQEAQAVNQGGTQFADRVSALEQQLAPQTIDDRLAALTAQLNGAPAIFGIAGDRLKTLMEQNRDSAAMLADQAINLETWARNRPVLGAWKGTLERGNLRGTINIYFRPSSAVNDTVRGTIGHTFHDGRGGRTTGNFVGSVDAFGVFRGTATVHNDTGSGSFSIAWDLNGDLLSGLVYNEDTITFRARRK